MRTRCNLLCSLTRNPLMRNLLLCAATMLAACGQQPVARTLPTAAIAQVAATTVPITLPTLSPLPATAATPTPPAVATPASVLEQYRLWMEEARALHPYAEPVEKMWDVMLCESSGNATLVAGPYHGLFQYIASTWGGAWNPYRERDILDPQAQILATASAWQQGYQNWWGCY